MNILQRRRAMMLVSAKEASPLYQLYQGSHTVPNEYRTITITGNHVNDNYERNSAADTTRSVRIDGTQVTYNQAIDTTWFSLRVGDVVTLRRKNASFQNYYQGASTISQINLQDTAGQTILNLSVTIPSKGSLTPDDAEESITLENNTDISCVLFYTNRYSLAEYDLELEVNGIRYL